ncbi:MAG: saccharopine dehydrogenase NADP-binding domain-containing protein, partial [Myxococcota bacterium]
MGREFDVVIWGASGFTGSLVAEYFESAYGDTLRWALAGRNRDKLSAVRDGLGQRAQNIELIVADSHDRASLDSMCERTTVVLTTVGPYAKYGSELVSACVAQGTHYCDLAGETQWIRRMIDGHHQAAEDAQTKIVHCCGFDSIPSDFGVWFLQQEAVRRTGSPCRSVTMLLKSAKGGFSGGTAASLINLVKEAKSNRDVRRVLANPYSLNPSDEMGGPDERDQQDVRFNDLAQSWTAPFVMAAINTRVVRRSHALLGYPWGREFTYREAVMTGPGAAGAIKAGAIAGGLGAVVTGASFDFSRGLLERFILPGAGEGPDA